jgi:Mor family transcriptional regulator
LQTGPKNPDASIKLKKSFPLPGADDACEVFSDLLVFAHNERTGRRFSEQQEKYSCSACSVYRIIIKNNLI